MGGLLSAQQAVIEPVELLSAASAPFRPLNKQAAISHLHYHLTPYCKLRRGHRSTIP